MNAEQTVQGMKDLFLALGRGDRETMLALAADDIEWIIPGQDWPLAGARRGHEGLKAHRQTASETVKTTFTGPSDSIAQGDRAVVAGSATESKTTGTTFEDDWVSAVTVRDGQMSRIPEYVDTEALARAAGADA